jgi:hypothetical protein
LRLGWRGSKSVFEEIGKAVAVGIGVGVSSESGRFWFAGCSSNKGALVPVRRKVVVGRIDGLDKDEAKAAAIGSGGPWKFVVVGEFLD